MKAFLTANPESDPDGCLVILRHEHRKLAFVRPGRHTKFWSHVHHRHARVSELAYSNGKLYGLEFSYTLVVQVFLFQTNPPWFVPILSRDLTPCDDSLLFFMRRLVDLNGELCLCVKCYKSSSTTYLKLFKINLLTGGLTRVFSLGDRCLFLSDYYSFSCETTYSPAEFFEQHQSKCSDLVSNYLFCVDYHLLQPKPEYYISWWDKNSIYNRYLFRRSDRSLDVEVWDMLHSTKVYSKLFSPTPFSYVPLWILPSIQ